MQTFDKEPSDSELAMLLAPASRSWLLQVDDTPERLVARPSGFLLPWGIFWLLVPLTVAAWYFVGKAVSEELDGWDNLAILMASLATPTLLGIIWWLNQLEISKGDFFVLDRLHRVLTLCRQTEEFGASQIVGFVEVCAWHRELSAQEDTLSWLGELTVLVRGQQGQTLRYPVVTSQHTRRVGWVARKLADCYGVELRCFRLDRKTRKRLAQGAE